MLSLFYQFLQELLYVINVLQNSLLDFDHPMYLKFIIIILLHEFSFLILIDSFTLKHLACWNTELPYDPGLHFRIYSRGMETYVHTRTCT